MDWLVLFNTPASGMAVLTAMITPAVLISACGTLILSTSSRLARVLERVRTMRVSVEELSERREQAHNFEERRDLMLEQMQVLARRGRLLQLSLTLFYLGVTAFVATSVAIGVIAAGATTYGWIPVVLALVGAMLLLAGSVILIAESRIALQAVLAEMQLVSRFAKPR